MNDKSSLPLLSTFEQADSAYSIKQLMELEGKERKCVVVGPASSTPRPDQWSTRLPTRDEIRLHGVKHALQLGDGCESQRTFWQVFFEGYPFPCTLMNYYRQGMANLWEYVPSTAGYVSDRMLSHVKRVRALDAEGTPVDQPSMEAVSHTIEHAVQYLEYENVFHLLKKMKKNGFSQTELQTLIEILRVKHKDNVDFEHRALTALNMITGSVGNSSYRVFE